MRIVIAFLMVVVLGAGTFNKPGNAAGVVALEGTAWQGVTLTSASGQVLEGAASLYQLEFRDDGGVRIKLDCNTAGGSYTSMPRDGGVGDLAFGAMRMTRAKCPQGSLDMVIVGQLGEVRSYQVAGNRLTLTLGNGGTLVWDGGR